MSKRLDELKTIYVDTVYKINELEEQKKELENYRLDITGLIEIERQKLEQALLVERGFPYRRGSLVKIAVDSDGMKRGSLVRISHFFDDYSKVWVKGQKFNEYAIVSIEDIRSPLWNPPDETDI
jgi:type VI protein secretion system component VasA